MITSKLLLLLLLLYGEGEEEDNEIIEVFGVTRSVGVVVNVELFRSDLSLSLLLIRFIEKEADGDDDGFILVGVAVNGCGVSLPDTNFFSDVVIGFGNILLLLALLLLFPAAVELVNNDDGNCDNNKEDDEPVVPVVPVVVVVVGTVFWCCVDWFDRVYNEEYNEGDNDNDGFVVVVVVEVVVTVVVVVVLPTAAEAFCNLLFFLSSILITFFGLLYGDHPFGRPFRFLGVISTVGVCAGVDDVIMYGLGALLINFMEFEDNELISALESVEGICFSAFDFLYFFIRKLIIYT